MNLPVIPQPTAVVRVGDTDVPVRGLARAEVMEIAKLIEDGASSNEVEVRLLAFGTNNPLEDVREWYASAPNEAVAPLTDAIRGLSGLNEGAQFRS